MFEQLVRQVCPRHGALARESAQGGRGEGALLEMTDAVARKQGRPHAEDCGISELGLELNGRFLLKEHSYPPFPLSVLKPNFKIFVVQL